MRELPLWTQAILIFVQYVHLVLSWQSSKELFTSTHWILTYALRKTLLHKACSSNAQWQNNDSHFSLVLVCILSDMYWHVSPKIHKEKYMRQESSWHVREILLRTPFLWFVDQEMEWPPCNHEIGSSIPCFYFVHTSKCPCVRHLTHHLSRHRCMSGKRWMRLGLTNELESNILCIAVEEQGLSITTFFWELLWLI